MRREPDDEGAKIQAVEARRRLKLLGTTVEDSKRFCHSRKMIPRQSVHLL